MSLTDSDKVSLISDPNTINELLSKFNAMDSQMNILVQENEKLKKKLELYTSDDGSEPAEDSHPSKDGNSN